MVCQVSNIFALFIIVCLFSNATFFIFLSKLTLTILLIWSCRTYRWCRSWHRLVSANCSHSKMSRLSRRLLTGTLFHACSNSLRTPSHPSCSSKRSGAWPTSPPVTASSFWNSSRTMRSPFWSASLTHLLTSKLRNKRSGVLVTSQETTLGSETHFSTRTSSQRSVSWSTLHLLTQVLHATPSGPYPTFARASQFQGLNKLSVRFRPLPKFLSRLILRRFLMTSAGRCHTLRTKVVTSVSLSSCRTTSYHAWFNSYATSKWLLRYLAFALSATCLLPRMNMLRLRLIKACSRLS